ncbi:hypothetical protein [Fusobacterium animalis]|uniref:hypothetical protein n=1 Tax=Fusobacterium animalis TaxID=76859 RepID=UPI0030D11C53
MKRLKSILLVLVIMLLSLGLASNTYARERAGENNREHSSRRSRDGRDNSGGRLDYDGRTSGLERELGGIVGGAAGGAIGGKYGGKTGRNIGAAAGREIGKRAGDAWERRANRGAHDKWNNKGRKDRGYGGGWRFSDEID